MSVPSGFEVRDSGAMAEISKAVTAKGIDETSEKALEFSYKTPLIATPSRYAEVQEESRRRCDLTLTDADSRAGWPTALYRAGAEIRQCRFAEPDRPGRTDAARSYRGWD